MTGVKAWRWRIEGKGPSVLAALRVGAAVRNAVLAQAGGCLPDAFHHGGGPTHGHPHWLPEDADNDGCVDHVLVFAPGGFPASVLPVFAGLTSIHTNGVELTLIPDSMGEACGPLFAASAVWRSLTPYIPPNNLRNKAGKPRTGEGGGKDYSPEAQLRREIASRLTATGERLWPDPDHIGWRGAQAVGRRLLAAEQFEQARPTPSGTVRPAPRHYRPPADAQPQFATLRFAKPVRGPLALGYGAHFGLGLFLPCQV